MATIDLIVLGMLKNESLSAYDLQKLVEYRHISRWVKISTPSIYKKVLQLEEKGYITSTPTPGKLKTAEKAVYSLTEAGEEEFQRLMQEIASSPIRIFLDLNAVIVNLPSLPPQEQKLCLAHITENLQTLHGYLEDNLREKEDLPQIPATGLAVLRQQLLLTQTLEDWLAELEESLTL